LFGGEKHLTAMQRKKSGFDVVRKIVMELFDVEEGTMHGAPAWKLRGKLLTCAAIHKSAEPNSLMVKIAPSERDQLLCTKPGTYYVTDHYLGDPVVLVRLSEVDRTSLQALLKKAWFFVNESGNRSGRKAGKQKVSRPFQGESKK
jgi:hypothetical protein